VALGAQMAAQNITMAAQNDIIMAQNDTIVAQNEELRVAVSRLEQVESSCLTIGGNVSVLESEIFGNVGLHMY
jgi:uncharacterized coiled-coil protein SlyX